MKIETRGSGPIKVLLLPAWYCTAESWYETVKWLDPEKYTVALPDYQGHGKRLDEAGDFSIRGIGKDMIDVVDSLGWTAYAVVGHSMGGKVAQYLLATDAERATAMVGVVPVAPGPLVLDEDTRRMMLASVEDGSLRAGIFQWATAARYSSYVGEKVTQESLVGTTPEAFMAHFLAWADDDITADIKGVAAPIKVLVGEHDSSITEEAMKQALLPHYPNSELEVLAATGHYPIYEVPVALASAIDRFLSEVQS